ncbi:FAD-binding oxidoreductase [Mycolicibacterium sp. P9-64]|uniref:FAD-binding and (Fe-S)-binding domain-containing protein n=1 Tax=Mycolicibacterium sp. P9-64 TaxID=2024612 RepID=UPI0011ECCB2A|nr:FAD-binding and (Fe-S)-binding domain-containing protein [Mycolicibacterium sp. P9-64]KAA0078886.1 FAD-binding oxidoreductase [Mycolicibacterium sp. P9-64]
MTRRSAQPALPAAVITTLERVGVPIDDGIAARSQFAYDASHYRVAPLAVAYPRSIDDVIALLAVCREHRIPVIPRGGGTSMAGNAIGRGIVVDFSRHMNAVLHVDRENRRAVVQPGLVLDDLQRAVRPLGMEFGPDPSSHSRATLGGMIGNDACGNHSVRHGRTGGHVVELELVLVDGTRVIAGRDGLHAVDIGDVARVANLNDELRSLVGDNLAPIRTQLGRISRQVSGYQLHHLLPENGFHVAKMLVGTEGTCAVIVAATVELVPTPPSALLVAIGYPDVVAAADDVPTILEFRPAAVEGMDASIVAAMRDRRGADAVAGLPDGGAWLFVDLDGDDDTEVAARADELVQRLRARGHLSGARVVPDRADRASLWRVREDGAGLSARSADGGQTWTGWEDSAVDPADLPAYLRDFRQLLSDHGRKGVMYGHFGAGCIHVRIDFDLNTEPGIAQMNTFVRAAAELVTRHGGTLSGEHGDGRARSELLSIMYGPQMLALFSAVKKSFDPDGLLNPGIIVDPPAVTADLGPLPLTVVLSTPAGFAYPHDRNGFSGAVGRCVGIAKCRSDVGGVMCPSYRATHDENHSTRGRARVLQEMVRGELVADAWRSTEARDALDLCLSCKACSSDCPVGVDMATYKSEFLHQHYRHRVRPLSHYSLGWLPALARLAGAIPRVVNSITGNPPLHRAMAAAGGVTARRAVPKFAKAGAAVGAARPHLAARGEHDAVLFVDTFTRAFRPELAGAAAEVLADAGVGLDAVAGACCGLTWITTGQLGMARRVLSRTARMLDSTGSGPVVVLEPSCAAALREDLPRLLPTPAARRVADRVTPFAELLGERLDAGWRPPPMPDEVVLQQHCHEYASFSPTLQQRVLARLGVTSVHNAAGCCGLAGNFGFEREHYDVSIDVAELALVPALANDAARTAILADGFSCQTQINHLNHDDNPEPVHLAQLLATALHTSHTNGRKGIHG